MASDCYSWNWDRLHLAVQLPRFGGDTDKGAASSLGWLGAGSASGMPPTGGRCCSSSTMAGTSFSIERWDPAAVTFDDHGSGPPHWWSEEQRAALLDTIRPYNIAGIFHGHEHDVPMIYRSGGYDLFKPTAAFMGASGLPA